MRKCAVFLALLAVACTLAGCSLLNKESVKLEDLDFTVLSGDKLPEELKSVLEERKTQPFQLTYSDKEYLYICIGYGEQATGGYSIAVDELYLTDNAVKVSTSLLGPAPSEKSNKTPSYPYIVLKTEFRDETVIFE